MSTIRIPPEALEAAVKAVLEHSSGMKDPPMTDLQMRRTRKNIQIACLAMLQAWPGMEPAWVDDDRTWFECDVNSADGIILPMQKETN